MASQTPSFEDYARRFMQNKPHGASSRTHLTAWQSKFSFARDPGGATHDGLLQCHDDGDRAPAKRHGLPAHARVRVASQALLRTLGLVFFVLAGGVRVRNKLGACRHQRQLMVCCQYRGEVGAAVQDAPRWFGALLLDGG